MYTDEELQVIMKKLKFIALGDAHINAYNVIYLERAARNGHTSAQTKLGQCYKYGVFVPKNKEKALQLFRSAMLLGDLGAKEELQKYFR